MPTDRYFAMTSCSVSETASEGEISVLEAVLPDNGTMSQHANVKMDHCTAAKTPLLLEITPVSKESEVDGDFGYLSHDTQEDSSQNSHLSARIAAWQQGGNEDEYMQGADDLDDLLYHFNNFFKEKLEIELDTFQASMRSILTEQQIHVHQIVHSTLTTTETEDFSSQQHPMDTSCGVSSKSSPERKDDLPMTSGNPLREESTNEYLTELLALSCGITAVLHEDKFRL